jgi:hypothetical protein
MVADPLYPIPQSGVFKRQFPGLVISLIAVLGQLSQSFNYKLRLVEAPVYACSSSQEQSEVDMIWSSPKFEGEGNVLSSTVLVW